MSNFWELAYGCVVAAEKAQSAKDRHNETWSDLMAAVSARGNAEADVARALSKCDFDLPLVFSVKQDGPVVVWDGRSVHVVPLRTAIWVENRLDKEDENANF